MPYAPAKYAKITLLIAGWLLAGNAASADQPGSKIPDLIENRTFGFRLANPEKWPAKKNKTDNLVLLGRPDKPKTNFVTVSVEDLSKVKGVTLETYRKQLMENLRKSVMGFELRGDESASVDGTDAHQIIYAGRLAEETMRWKTVFTIQKNRAYVLTYASEDDEYFKHLESADKILYSFRFI